MAQYKLKKNESITSYVHMFLHDEPMARLEGGHHGRKYLLPTGDTDDLFTNVTSMTGGLSNFGLEKYKEMWLNMGFDKHMGKQLTPYIVDDITTGAKRDSERSAAVGSELHEIIEGLLFDQTVDYDNIPDQLEPAVRGFLKWRESRLDWQLIATEIAVYHRAENADGNFTEAGNNASYRNKNRKPKWVRTYIPFDFAGTVDAIFLTPKGYMAVDWKTTRNSKSGPAIREGEILQMSAYVSAIRQMLGTLCSKETIDVNNEHVIGGQIVRFKNDYLTDSDGRAIRTEPKQFTDEVETVDLTPLQCSEWMLSRFVPLNKLKKKPEHLKYTVHQVK